MALPIPNLDDRTFNDLMEEARSLIPIYNKEWTNHNTPDPGITLLELFAWLWEMVIFRINQIPEQTYRQYLKLIGIDYLFCWDRIGLVPGEDSAKLLNFLTQRYNLDWVKMARIARIDGNTVTVTKDHNQITLKLDESKKIMSITLGPGTIDEFQANREISYLFNWDKVPGNENYRLNEFLIQNYAMDWVQNAKISKNEDQKTIIISDGFNNIELKLCSQLEPLTIQQVEMSVDIGNKHQFILKKEPKTLFHWSKIPGEDNPKLLQFLIQYYGCYWANQIVPVKSSNGKTITVADEKNSVLIGINDEQDQATFTFTTQDKIVTWRKMQPVFDWERVPGADTPRLVNFLKRYYGLSWLKTSDIQKDASKKKLIIKDDKITIEQSDDPLENAENLVKLTFVLNAGNSFTIDLFGEDEYVFNWDQVEGSDKGRLLDFLYQNYSSAYWVKAAVVKLVDTKTIRVYLEETHQAVLVRNEAEGWVDVTFDLTEWSRFSIQSVIDIEEDFDWERFSDTDQINLRDYLIQNYPGANWVRIASMEKVDSQTIRIYLEKTLEAVLIRNEAGDRADLTFNIGNTYGFSIKKKLENFFNWDQYSDKDQKAIKDFLIQNYGLTVARIAKDDKKKTIRVTTRARGAAANNSIGTVIIRLNDDADLVTMVFNTGNDYRFGLQKDNGWINIYQDLGQDIRRGLEEISERSQRYRAITNVDFVSLAIEAMEHLKPNLAGRVICVANRDLEYSSPDLEKLGHVSLIIIPKSGSADFCWGDLNNPELESDDYELRQFFARFYGDWVNNARILKSVDSNQTPDFKMTTISDEYNTIILEAEDDNFKKIILRKERITPLFNWDKLPGEDNYKLLEHLTLTYDRDWIRNAVITKEGSTITVTGNPTNNEVISLELDSNITEVNLRRVRTVNVSYTENNTPYPKTLAMDNLTQTIYRTYSEPGCYELVIKKENGHLLNVYAYCASENKPSALLRDLVCQYLEERRLITTRVHVVAADFRTIKLEVTLALQSNTNEEKALAEANSRITKFFSPLEGGDDGKGWPLGRGLYRSEVYHLLESIPGVDHVAEVIIDDQEELLAQPIAGNQLIMLELTVQAEKKR
ncbi:MAG: baseplate J/gp47 family protein [Firmicutes bacterium]|nr:baseplate J/gp47 family protein [Bacillota bacterium]